MENILLLNSKNYKISTKIYLPESNKIKEIIIACHGFAGDKESSAIKMLAEEMVKFNIGVICFDFPGHGESKINGNYLTISNCINDINTVENYIKKNYGNIPINIFATSFGAYISLLNIAKNNKKYKNIILRAPAIRMANIFRYNLLKEPEDKYKNKGYTKLGYEREIILPYSFMEELDKNDIFSIYKNIDIPEIFIVQGNKDDIAPIENTKEFVSLNPRKIKLFIIEDADHRMKGPGELEKAINYAKNILIKNKGS